MTATFSRLSVDSDLMLVSLEAALKLLKCPEGRVILHVPPERAATDTEFLDKLLVAWREEHGARYPIGIVGDQDLHDRQWFLERRGRRAGSGDQ